MTVVSLCSLVVAKFTDRERDVMTNSLKTLGIESKSAEVFDLTTWADIVDYSVKETGRVVTIEKRTARENTYYLVKVYSSRCAWGPDGVEPASELFLRVSIADAVAISVKVACSLI